MRRRKSRFYRWIVAMLMVALLAGQCNVSVLAKEEIVSQKTGASGEKKEDGTGGGAFDDEDSDATGDGAPKKDGESDIAGNAGDGGSGNGDTEGGVDDGAGDAGISDGGDSDGAGDDETGDGNSSDGEGAESGSGDTGSNHGGADGDENNGGDSENGTEQGGTDNVGGAGKLPVETVSGNEVEIEEAEETVADYVAARLIGDEFEVESGIKYRVTADGQIEVIGHRDKTAVSGELVIPETDVDDQGNTYQVTAVAAGAFGYCESLNSVKLSDSVVSIGTGAFENCSGLNNIELPEHITCIEERTFLNCGSLGSIAIPDSVTSIGSGAFYDCRRLSGIEIPDSVTSIGRSAFANCNNLSRVRLPKNITNMETAVFYGCAGLSSIEIPDSVLSIGESAFQFCTGLDSMEIPGNVVNIGNNAFTGCSALNDVKIPDSVISIGKSAFWGCNSLSDIKIPSSVTSIGDSAFSWSGLTSIEIPDSITEISSGCFNSCKNLRSVKIPGSVTDIKYGGFWECSALDTMWMTISSGAEIEPPAVELDAFGNLSDNRFLIFLSEDGTRLTGEDFAMAKSVYLNDQQDGSVTDGLWWGWTIKETESYKITYHLDDYMPTSEECRYTLGGRVLPVPRKSGFVFDGWYANADYSGDKVSSIGSTETGDKEYYGRWIKKAAPVDTVILTVRKDDQEWGEHGKCFMLLPEGGDALIELSEAVPEREYLIYDVTGAEADALLEKGVNTGISPVIADGKLTAAVDYYTVTFYDGDTAYPAGTSQAQQIILRGQRAKRPAEPAKTGYRFNGWKTRDGGTTDFDFNETVNEKTSVYASWEADTKKPSGGKPGGDKKPDDREPGENNSPGESGDRTMAIVQTAAPKVVSDVAPASLEPEDTVPEKEPKTDDPTPVEVYATVAMVAGLTYLLLCFMEEGRGMSEREKEVFVAAFIRWAKKGGRFRKCCAMVAIFCILVYYHAIGKHDYKKNLSTEAYDGRNKLFYKCG